jgi:hypothetical protein
MSGNFELVGVAGSCGVKWTERQNIRRKIVIWPQRCDLSGCFPPSFSVQYMKISGVFATAHCIPVIPFFITSQDFQGGFDSHEHQSTGAVNRRIADPEPE